MVDSCLTHIDLPRSLIENPPERRPKGRKTLEPGRSLIKPIVQKASAGVVPL